MTRRPHPFDDRPHTTLLALGVPILLTGLAEPVAGLVDTGFVRALGAEAASALGVGTAVLSGVLWIFNFLAISSQTEVARRLGADRPGDASRQAHIALAAAAGLGCALAVVLWVAGKPLSAWMGAEAGVRDAAWDYIAIRALGAPFVLCTITGAGILRGAADVRTPLAVAVAVNALNVGLDALWIPGVPALGIPAFGIAGAAWATTTAQSLGAVATVVWIRRRLGRPAASASATGWPRELADLFRVGFDLFVRTSLLWVFLLAGVRAATRCGAEAGAAHQAIRSLWILTAIALDAFAYAAQTLAGWFLGAGDLRSARRVAAAAVVQALAAGFALAGVMLALGSTVRAAFVPESAWRVFDRVWWIAAVSQPMNALSFVTDGVHWATRDYGFLRNAMLAATATGLLGLTSVDHDGPPDAGLRTIWLVTAAWISIRALAGVARIWPGIGRAPLGRG